MGCKFEEIQNDLVDKTKLVSVDESYDWVPDSLEFPTELTMTHPWRVRLIRVPGTRLHVVYWVPVYYAIPLLCTIVISLSVLVVAAPYGIFTAVPGQRLVAYGAIASVALVLVLVFAFKIALIRTNKNGIPALSLRLIPAVTGGTYDNEGIWKAGKRFAIVLAIELESECVRRLHWNLRRDDQRLLVVGMFHNPGKAVAWVRKLYKKNVITDIKYDRSAALMEVVA